MTKRIFNLRSFKGVAIVICLAGITVFSGCDKGGENDPNKDGAITVADNSSLTQEVFADKTTGSSSVSFTTTGAWTSERKTQTTLKSAKASENDDWYDWTPKKGDIAGDYNLAITLEPNVTGADRVGIITILCNGKEKDITITQKATLQNGELLTIKDFLVAHPWKHQITTHYNQNRPEEVSENSDSYMITFNADGTTTHSSIPAYTISGNILTMTMVFHTFETITLLVDFTISKYSDKELVLADGNIDGEIFTMKFIKP